MPLNPMSEEREHAQRRALLAAIKARLGPIAPRFEAAILAVDRARFVRNGDHERAWIDEPLPLDTPHGHGVATISAPHAYVLGFDATELQAGDRFLELGSGTGYGAALAAQVVGPTGTVTTVDVDPHFARLSTLLTAHISNVHTLHADGLARPDLVAVHDKCWLTFSVAEVPVALLQALQEGAILVAPVGSDEGNQVLFKYQRRGHKIEREDLGAVRFVPARSLITG
ncbi:MAG: protein-L-isoaspartate O-methyltransferase [Polyangiales bacterium]